MSYRQYSAAYRKQLARLRALGLTHAAHVWWHLTPRNRKAHRTAQLAAMRTAEQQLKKPWRRATARAARPAQKGKAK
jgi:hypothetical protein